MTTASDFIRANRIDAIKRNGYGVNWLGDNTYTIISHGVSVFNGSLDTAFKRYATTRGNWHYKINIAPSGKELWGYPIENKYYGLHALKHQTNNYINSYKSAGWTYKKWENLSKITRDMFLRLGNRFVLGILSKDNIELVITLSLEFKD